MVRKYLLQGNVFKENILYNLILLSFPYIYYTKRLFMSFFDNRLLYFVKFLKFESEALALK